MSLIELDDITKDYGALRALDGVSLKIEAGITGLLGPNGAGKSTLIKVLLGLLRVTRGRAKVLGYELGRQDREIRANVGYMPEDDCFLPGLTGVEAVQFVARLSRYPRIEALRRAHEILDFCGMGQERYRTAETFSTGMRQKLRFAQSLVHDPPILILDEPTSGLDPGEREATLNRIKLLAQKHDKTILLCTHILPDVQSVSDAVVILSRGKVRVADTLARLSRSEHPAVHVRLWGNPQPFIDGLERRGREARTLETGLVSIEGESEELAGPVWEAARECGVAVRSMVPSRNSLEDIFMSAVRETPVGRT